MRTQLDSSYLSNGRLHPAVIRSNNRASRACEASQLEAETSDEEIIPPIEVTIAAGATLNSSARASTFRKRKIHVNEGKYKQREAVARPRPQGKETKQALGMA